MKRPKIPVIGAGNIGATTALRLAEAELGDEEIFEIKISPEEREALRLSASHVRELCERLRELEEI